jgi:hypothetical protein
MFFMKTIAFVAIALFSFSSTAWADHPFTIARSAIPIKHNGYRIETGLQMDNLPKGRQANTFSLSFLYGLIHNMEVGAQIPYLYAREGVVSHDQLGDVTLLAKVRFLKGRDAAPISLASLIDVKLPSASRDVVVDTTGEPDVRLGLVASKTLFPYHTHLNMAHTFIGNPPKQERSDRQDYSLTVEYETMRPGLLVMGRVFGSASKASHEHASGNADSSEKWFAAATGASYQLRESVVVDGSVAIGLSHHAPDSSFNLRVSYHYN